MTNYTTNAIPATMASGEEAAAARATLAAPADTLTGPPADATGAGHPKPYLTIRRTSGWAAINLRELWHFRNLMFTLAGRDLKLRYKQTALGVIWVVLQPLMAAGIFSFVFGTVAKLPTDGVPTFVFTFAGLLAWNLFSGTLSKCSGCLIGNSHLISKVFFPRLVLPLSTVPSTLVDFGVSLAMMAVLMVTFRTHPSAAVLLLPVWLGLLLMLALGVGLCAAALTVNYRDVQYILPVVMQVLLYASPVAYSVSAVPAEFQPWFATNPLVGLLQGARWSILGTPGPPGWMVTYAACMSVVAFLIGAFSFKRMERRFADAI
jgi:lipopolysaccharide transport system permease protein